jgi:hypothetical protein
MTVHLEWREVRRTQWSEPRPPAPNGSCPGGTDYFTAVWKQATWPQDGSQYAGITYEDEMTWIGPEPGFAHAVVSHSQYPAPEEGSR